jgi:ABC-type multidrug transport system permease subunit
LIGSLTVTEDKVIGLCILLSLVMAALGGCWWPLEIVPDSMKVAAHVVPAGWAMDALHQLISFGGGWEKVRFPVGVLFLYGLAAHLAAAKCFRY